jgi:hypothetical protein
MTANSTLDRESFQEILASAFVVQQSLIDVQLPAAMLTVRRMIAAGDIDENGIMHLIAGRARNLANATGAAVGLLKGNQLVYRAGTGSAATYVGRHLTATLSVSAKTNPNGEILRVEDAETDVGIGAGICRQFGAKSLLILPIYHEQVLGVLQIFFNEAHAFQDEEVCAYRSMVSMVMEVMTHTTKVGPKDSVVPEVSTMPAIHATTPPTQRSLSNSGSLANSHSIWQAAGAAIAESEKLPSGGACSAAATIMYRTERVPSYIRMRKVADLAAVVIVLVSASWISYSYRRPALPTEEVLARRRSNIVTQQVPAEIAPGKKDVSTPQTASVPMKDVWKAARSAPRRVKVGEYEIDYLSEDVTVRHFTGKPALQQALHGDDQVKYVSEDVTVRHFAPKLPVVSPRQPVHRAAAVRSDACSATGINQR